MNKFGYIKEESEIPEEKKQLSFEEAFAADMEQETRRKQIDYLVPHDLNIQALSYLRIKFDGILPSEFVFKILKDIEESKMKTSKFIQRLIPIDIICGAEMSEIKDTLKTQYTRFRESNLDEPMTKKFAFIPQIRLCNKVSKDEIFSMSAELVRDHYNIDLKNPDYVIMFQIFKNYCGISFLKDYFKLKKYNVESIFATSLENTNDNN
ncbi:hypothetical protein ROZALSC1DRAFT_21193 [Rozella allomycis CSF55]|uniref:THUMP domain-containing protein n=1 Tax=Rozella allomycis (strain CSF55) TaxID=988480 RepID=A0A4V1J083_ROZAC|nr:hypothetical protein ROZALSC1DRAFT_21193 [Rozella allomycis CSF55]